jgi:hypothetical protein
MPQSLGGKPLQVFWMARKARKIEVLSSLGLLGRVPLCGPFGPLDPRDDGPWAAAESVIKSRLQAFFYQGRTDGVRRPFTSELPARKARL